MSENIEAVKWTRRQVRLRYEKLRSSIDNFENFMIRGAHYELDRDDAVLYREICDLEFLLGTDRDLCTGILRADREGL